MSKPHALTVYVYPPCSTCKNALKFLKDLKVDHQSIDIVQTPPSKAELKQMLAIYNGEIKKLFNTSGELYRSLKLSHQIDDITPAQAINLLAENGKLIKRPFAISPFFSAVGFKVDEWKAGLGK